MFKLTQCSCDVTQLEWIHIVSLSLSLSLVFPLLHSHFFSLLPLSLHTLLQMNPPPPPPFPCRKQAEVLFQTSRTFGFGMSPWGSITMTTTSGR